MKPGDDGFGILCCMMHGWELRGKRHFYVEVDAEGEAVRGDGRWAGGEHRYY